MKSVRTKLAVIVVGIGIHWGAFGEQVFEGDWRGKVELIGSDEELGMRIVITSDEASNYYCDGGSWRRAWAGPQVIETRRNNALMWWTNEGGNWTETQTFSLSHVDTDTMTVAWSRHVNNFVEEGSNDTWHRFGYGILKRVVESSVECE